MNKDALESLWGRTTEEGERAQTALTGQPIADVVDVLWGRIGMDPCAAPKGLLWVPCMFCGGTAVNKKRRPCKSCKKQGGSLQTSSIRADVEIRRPGDGLTHLWADKTFCNPPYSKLEPWLMYNQIEDRVIWYIPVRCNRKWWREWARRCSVVVALNPQSFKGHRATFPMPLCLGFKGSQSGADRFASLCKAAGLGEAL